MPCRLQTLRRKLTVVFSVIACVFCFRAIPSMFDAHRRYRELRPASVLVVFAALTFCGYNVHRALGFGSHVEQASLAAENLPSSGDINLDQFGDPVLTKADASTLTIMGPSACCKQFG